MMRLRNIALVMLLFCAFPFYGQNPDKRFKMADSLLDAGEYGQSLALSLQLAGLYPKEAEVYINLAYCYNGLMQNQECLDAVEKAMALPADPDEKHALYYLQADCYSRMERYDEAMKYCIRYLKYYPKEACGLNLKGWLLYSDSKYDEAIVEFKRAMEDEHISNGEKAYSQAMTGFCYLEKNDLKTASLYRDMAMTSDRDNFDVNFLSANILFHEKDFKGALKIYSSLSEKDTADNALLYKTGDCYFYLKEYDKALAKYKASFVKDSASTDINNIIAWTLFMQERYSEALPYANRAIALDKGNSNAYDTRGCIWYKNGNYTAAIKDFDKAIGMDKSSVNSYYFRGLCFLKTGRVKEACDDLGKASADKAYQIPAGETPVEALINTNCKK